jgi:hypothetical protein
MLTFVDKSSSTVVNAKIPAQFISFTPLSTSDGEFSVWETRYPSSLIPNLGIAGKAEPLIANASEVWWRLLLANS